MLKKNFYKILPVILLAAAIALSPSFDIGSLEGGRPFNIRAEDILLLFLSLAWFFAFLASGKNKFKKQPLFFAILSWLSIGFFSLLTNWIFGNTPLLRGFFFFLKEIEFFLIYFYVFFKLDKRESIIFITETWVFLGFIHAAWIIFELFTGSQATYYYGPTSFIHPDGILSGAGLFLMIFIPILNVFLYYYKDISQFTFKKIFVIITIISLMVGIIASGSRNVFWSALFAIFLTLLLYAYKNNGPKKFLSGVVSVVAVFVLIGIVYLAVSHCAPGVQRLFNRDTMIAEFIDKNPYSISRVDVWQAQLNEFLKRPLFLFFGFGKAVFPFYADSDSQYVRNFVEVGIVGSLVFFFLFFLIIKKSLHSFLYNNDPFITAYSAGLIVATLAMFSMSISSEVFTAVKIAEVYWFFTAIAMAALTLESKFLQPK